MTAVVGVKFRKAGKTYYFSPGEFVLSPGQGVIVETARGLEFGTIAMPRTEVREEDLVKPLRKVVRIADQRDLRRHEENEKKRGEAMAVCRRKIEEHGLDMKLIDVGYTFDNNKIIFYFTADGHVDFRELVRDLAGIFHMRIELRQVGVRDEAKMLGGIGTCGRELCCASWLTGFQPVSIKMTKNQNMSLNPTKLSGACGRLMCCIKYENDVYVELRRGMPDLNENVRTEEGVGKVVEANILSGTVKVRMFTGEEDEYGRDKLDSEIYTFRKEDVERLGKGRRPGREDPPRQGKRKRDSAGERNSADKEGAEEGAERESASARAGKKNGRAQQDHSADGSASVGGGEQGAEARPPEQGTKKKRRRRRKKDHAAEGAGESAGGAASAAGVGEPVRNSAAENA